MSGIVGMINLDGAPIDRELVWRLTDFLSSRGPESQQVWLDRGVGLGHSLLRTTPNVQNDSQPATLDGKVWLIADARIDAQKELLANLPPALNNKGKPSDAELILYAYQAWGDECVRHLIGDFAFAIWDGRSNRLFCARDHLGVKPFFYAHISNSLIVSNTLNAVRLHPKVSDSLNELAIGDYLIFGLNQDLSTTTFSDIHRLPAAHTLTVSNGHVKTSCYWKPTTSQDLRFGKHEDYVESFDELLVSAIADRSKAEKASVLMSGGLDSTSVAAIAHKQLQDDGALHACSVVYDSLIPDEERKYSSTAAQHLGIDITHIEGDKHSLFDHRGLLELNQAEPFLISPFASQFMASLRVCAAHARIALTGWDGDALMNEPADRYFQAAAGALRLKDVTSALAWYLKSQKRLPGFGLRARFRRLRGKEEAHLFFPEWLDESFAKRNGLRERLTDLTNSPHKPDNTRPAALKALASKVWGPLLEGYDAGATGLALEVRHPLIDVRLIDFLLNIPAVPWCVNKHILRVAMQNRLPTVVLNRKKTPLQGDPALQMARRGSVRWLDFFEVNSQLSYFVDLKRRQLIADEQTSDRLWASLRVYALNYWLSNSLRVDRSMPGNRRTRIEQVTQTSIA